MASLSYQFATLIDESTEQFGGHEAVVEALNTHFSDDCGYGGKVIKKIIALIENSLGPEEFEHQLDELMDEEDEKGYTEGEAYGTSAVEMIKGVLEEWKKNGEMAPKVWW